MKRIQRLGLWTGLVLGFLCVNTGGSQQIKIKEVNGIPVVYNPKKPAPLAGTPSQLTLEEELTLGTKEKGVEDTFESIAAVRSDEESHIYVLDGKAGTVKVFDKAGQHLRNIGRRGQGPGEFEMPMGLNIISGQTLIVASMGRLSFFSLQGEYLKHITNTTFDPIPRLDSQGNIIARVIVKGEKMRDELVKFDPNFTPIFTITQLDRGLYSPGMKRNPFPAQIYYSVMTDDSIVWGINSQYTLTIVNRHGNISRKIVKEYEPLKVTEEDKQSLIRQRRGTAGQYEFPDNYPAFRDIHSDDENRIFVGTYELDLKSNRYFDVFDAIGRYIAKIAFAGIPLFWKQGKLYCVEEDEKGFQLVKRYRATWK